MILVISARIFGCNKVITKTRSDLIKSSFYKDNKEILDSKRGGGYWLWKYHFIKELIDEVNENDIIVYADAGLFFRKSIKKLINILINKTNGVLLFHNAYANREWTKRDCFVKLECESEDYYSSPLIFGGLQIFQKKEFSIKFIDEVLYYSCLDEIITDSPNILGKQNIDGFIEHRHDQSITSLVAHKNGIVLYPDPSQFKTKDVIYQFPNETVLKGVLYENIIYVHRFAGPKILSLFK